MSSKKSLPTAQRLREVFLYDPHEGKLIRKSTGYSDWAVSDTGYQQLTLDGKCLKVHRLIYCWMTGEWPKHEIDHKNRDKIDNRWENLRHATPSQNKMNCGIYRNNTSGYKGVQKITSKRYRAALRIGGKYQHIGYFECPKAAHEAYCKVARKHFGEYFAAA